MRRRQLVVSVALAAAAFSIPLSAFADSCANVQRAAPQTTSQGPVVKGNWVYLPSIDPQAPSAWGFAPPGGADSVIFNMPGHNGNYTNGKTSSLLGASAHCPGANPNQGKAPQYQAGSGLTTGCE